MSSSVSSVPLASLASLASSKRKKKNNKRPVPLAPPPAMRSRKKARIVTSLFHKYTRELDDATMMMTMMQDGANDHDNKNNNNSNNNTQNNNYNNTQNAEKVTELQAKLAELGGRAAYQQASQLSTSFFSTSKWVLGHLARSGWLYGIHIDNDHTNSDKFQAAVPVENDATTTTAAATKKTKSRRNLQILEVGAINTELLDAAKQTKVLPDGTILSKYRLSTRAIDLRSSHHGIEEADFLTFPLNNYDVVVCSMVINCVPRPDQRGLMLTRLYHQLRPGGLCFLTLPRLCLNQSPYMSMERFKALLTETGVGFQLEETKESPKVAFFILRRPTRNDVSKTNKFHLQWTTTKIIHRGKKFRNVFDVTLKQDEVDGTAWTDQM